MLNGKKIIVFMVLFTLLVLPVISLYAAASGKIAFVDLRRTFYEYEKAKNMEKELNTLADGRGEERTKKIEEITKLRDELELLQEKAKEKKQSDIDAKLAELQEFDKVARQEILTKRNDMFREVIDDIQKVVDELGKKNNYEYIFDSRDIMYAKKEFDITDEVLKTLNK